MRVEDVGEFGLIARLAALVRQYPPHQGLMLGIGDDAAAWKSGQGEETEVCTTDTMVAGVHFLSDRMPWEAVGWKAMASNLSDVAAMGCEPRYAVVTLGVPGRMEVADVDALYQGMLDCCREYGGSIVGGDVVGSPVFFVTVAATGVTRGELLTRQGARPGDRVVVTGTLGASAGGLRLLLGSHEAPERAASALKEAHFRPSPRVAEGQSLAREGVRAAIDISDGLVADLEKLCQASGVAAVLRADTVPVAPALKDAFPDEALALALSGGEDYELLVTLPEGMVERVRSALATPVSVVGEVVEGEPGRVRVVDAWGSEVEVRERGWDHLRRGL